ncbi:hypothetical protein GQ600_4281 [Phytophthora cactorum]|nr:hypothetical protein GQ600_4281 [Phytophthora cactorum]
MKQTITDYLHFRDVRKRRLHDEQWKEVRRQNNLVAFKERESWRQQHQTLCTPDGRLEPVVCKTSVPTLLVLGALQGTLDDEMYGMHMDSDNGAKLRSSYIHDQVNDFRVLTRIRGATKDDPFRNTGYGPFAKKRDYCVVTSMGVTNTVRGERLGYYVVHSVDVSSNDPMGRSTQLGLGSDSSNGKYIRAKGSMCWLKCELPNGSVELYMQGFFALWTSDTAYSKKIRWMLHDSVRSTHWCRRRRRTVSVDVKRTLSAQEKEIRVLYCLSSGELCTFPVRVHRIPDFSVVSSIARVQFLSDDTQSDGGCGGGQRRTTNTMLHLLAVHRYAKQTSATEFAAREMAMARARSNRALSTETSEYIL